MVANTPAQAHLMNYKGYEQSPSPLWKLRSSCKNVILIMFTSYLDIRHFAVCVSDKKMRNECNGNYLPFYEVGVGCTSRLRHVCAAPPEFVTSSHRPYVPRSQSCDQIMGPLLAHATFALNALSSTYYQSPWLQGRQHL